MQLQGAQERLNLDLKGANSSADVRQVGVIGTLVNTFYPPYQATTARTAATNVLVVSAGNSIFSAEIEGPPSAQ